MARDADLLRRARLDALEVSLRDLLNARDVVTAQLSDKVPAWLNAELACEGLQIYRERHGAWILAPLDE
ncbi:hypothetical protein [Paraburkholderia sp. J69-2]|uniref:hypothetical protein n=1 Tax=Paraburkholderia sp. J69-2 TaxID=2805437 RepID=UPI002AAF28DA|nr:hypothetical protein [Paraburkholderia sp. J69-2]